MISQGTELVIRVDVVDKVTSRRIKKKNTLHEEDPVWTAARSMECGANDANGSRSIDETQSRFRLWETSQV